MRICFRSNYRWTDMKIETSLILWFERFRCPFAIFKLDKGWIILRLKSVSELQLPKLNIQTTLALHPNQTRFSREIPPGFVSINTNGDNSIRYTVHCNLLAHPIAMHDTHWNSKPYCVNACRKIALAIVLLIIKFLWWYQFSEGKMVL